MTREFKYLPRCCDVVQMIGIKWVLEQTIVQRGEMYI